MNELMKAGCSKPQGLRREVRLKINKPRSNFNLVQPAIKNLVT